MPSASACLFANAYGLRVGSLNGQLANPLIVIARLNKPFDNGLIICICTADPPADAPNIVIEFGSPPKSSIFSLIHFNAND